MHSSFQTCWLVPHFRRSQLRSPSLSLVNLLCIMCLAIAYVRNPLPQFVFDVSVADAAHRCFWTQYRCRAATPSISLACRSLCRASPLDARSPAPCAALLCLENYQRCVERTAGKLQGLGFCSSWIAGAAIHGQWTVVLGKGIFLKGLPMRSM